MERHLVGVSLQGRCPDIASEPDQELIERRMADAKTQSGSGVGLLVLDNLEALMANCQNRPDWKAVNAWVGELKSRGVTVLIVHHPNKKGDMLGTVAIRNSLDAALLLEDEGDENKDCIAYALVWDKARDLSQSERKPIHVELDPNEKGPDIVWWTDGDGSNEARDARIREMVEEGVWSNQEMADEVNMGLEAFKKLKAKLGLTNSRRGRR
jgi:putative DNA primase/helicase